MVGFSTARGSAASGTTRITTSRRHHALEISQVSSAAQVVRAAGRAEDRGALMAAADPRLEQVHPARMARLRPLLLWGRPRPRGQAGGVQPRLARAPAPKSAPPPALAPPK